MPAKSLGTLAMIYATGELQHPLPHYTMNSLTGRSDARVHSYVFPLSNQRCLKGKGFTVKLLSLKRERSWKFLKNARVFQVLLAGIVAFWKALLSLSSPCYLGKKLLYYFCISSLPTSIFYIPGRNMNRDYEGREQLDRYSYREKIEDERPREKERSRQRDRDYMSSKHKTANHRSSDNKPRDRKRSRSPFYRR